MDKFFVGLGASLVFASWSPVIAQTDTLSNTAIFNGTIKSRIDVRQQARHPLGGDYTMAMGGVIGMLFAQLAGTPAHSQYEIYGGPGKLLRLQAKEIFDVGTCVSVKGPSAAIQVGVVDFGKAQIEMSTGCPDVPPDPPIQQLENVEVKQKLGRPN